MALGIQLYLVTQKDIPRTRKWLKTIGDSCSNKWFLPTCFFCPTDDCVIRPQDYAALANAVNYLQKTAGLEDLPDGGILRGLLGTFSGWEVYGNAVSAQFNNQGYSSHIAAVALLQFKITGETSPVVDIAARKLRSRNPGNAFYSYIASAPKSEVLKETLAKCSGDPSKFLYPKNQWIWETDNTLYPTDSRPRWEHGSLWDCILMAKLIEKMI